jgi:hypothetical protein
VRLQLIALGFVTSACADASGPRPFGAQDAATANPDAGVTPAAKVGSAGVYFVPPQGPTSTYAVTDVSWRLRDGVARLDYPLPRLLVGQSERVSFEGRVPAGGGSIMLSSDDGTAVCTLRPSASVSLRCEERFRGIEVDLEGVRREAERVDPDRVNARVEVSRRFSIEPIGVLEIPSR